MTVATALFAKGSTFRSTLDFIRAERGAAALERVLASVPPAVRESAERAAPTSEVDYDRLLSLWAATEREFAATDPTWAERAGAWSISERAAQMYGGILRKKDPTEFLTQSVSLFRLFYHPGNMEVVDHGAGHAVLRLVGFDARTPLFCRRQTGGLAQALTLAGGERPVARHVRCALDGDAFCEWELTWNVSERTSREGPAVVLESR